MKKFAHFWPYFLLGMLILLLYMLQPAPEGGAVVETLSDTKKIAFTTAIEANKFVLSVAFIFLGFFGSILLGKFQMRRNASSDIFLLVSCVFSLLAVWLGYEYYDFLIRYLNNGISDLELPYLNWPRKAQMVCIVFAALGFLIFVYNNRSVTKPEENEPEKTVD